jgi:aconitate hydratase 2/2-methylisocitrate dehydratase
MGDVVTVHPYAGKITDEVGETVSTFELKTQVLLDEVQAGGRIPLIIGRTLTGRAREALGLPASEVFRQPEAPADSGRGYSLAQKMVGRACGVEGGPPSAPRTPPAR